MYLSVILLVLIDECDFSILPWKLFLVPFRKVLLKSQASSDKTKISDDDYITIFIEIRKRDT